MGHDGEKVLFAARAGAQRSLDAQMNLLRQFCGINCGTGNIEGNKKVVALVDRVLEEMGVEAEHIDAAAFGVHIVARVRPENPAGKIVLNAHLDTAFFSGEKAEDHPFRIDGKFAYGLGVADCKGGLVTILYAVKNMKEAGLLPNKEIVMIFNCDEEVGSPTSMDIFRREAAGCEAVYCFEPGRNQNGVLTARRGTAAGKIIVHGIAAHAGLDGGTGASAVRELVNLVAKLMDRSDLSVGMYYNVATLSGGGSTIVIPDYAEAGYSVPLDSSEVFERVKKDVLEFLPAQGIVEGCRIETTVNEVCPPMERTEAAVRVYESIREAAELMGQELPEEKSFNSADGNLLAGMGFTVVDGLGPYMYEMHTTNEHMLIPTLAERTCLFGIVLGLM